MIAEKTMNVTRAFRDLCLMEPRLFELWMDASTLRPHPDGGFCVNRAWSECFKPRLNQLAGWEAENPELRSELYYDIAYTAIYYAMPDCTHEGMCW